MKKKENATNTPFLKVQKMISEQKKWRKKL